MDIFSTLLALCKGKPPIIGGLLSQKPVTRNFGVFFLLRLNEEMDQQTIETLVIWDSTVLIMTSL